MANHASRKSRRLARVLDLVLFLDYRGETGAEASEIRDRLGIEQVALWRIFQDLAATGIINIREEGGIGRSSKRYFFSSRADYDPNDFPRFYQESRASVGCAV